MSVYVACSSCHTTFPADTHAGLVRCENCEERAAPRIGHVAGHVIDFDNWA